MTGPQKEVLFYVFTGFFILIGFGSLAVLLGLVKGADKTFRQWAVGGFLGAVTAAVVGMFRLTFVPTPALFTVTLLPPNGSHIELTSGVFLYDETSKESSDVTTHKGNVVAVVADGGAWQVRLPGVVVDKAVTLNFQDSAGQSWVAGPFYPNVIQQQMRLGQKSVAIDWKPSLLSAASTVVFAAEAGRETPAQQQAAIKFDNYARRVGDQAGRPYYEWRIFVDEKPEVLGTIQQVDYLLSPTFPNPFRSSRDRDRNFELVTSGSGAFRIVITVHYTNGTEAKTSYMLDLGKSWPAKNAAASGCNTAKVALQEMVGVRVGDAVVYVYLAGQSQRLKLGKFLPLDKADIFVATTSEKGKLLTNLGSPDPKANSTTVKLDEKIVRAFAQMDTKSVMEAQVEDGDSFDVSVDGKPYTVEVDSHSIRSFVNVTVCPR
jgi:hypothetical protein